MQSSKSEDCLIFYAFTPEFTKYKHVSSAITEFMKNKQISDPSDRFNLIMFLKDGPNYLDQFTFDPDHILKTLKSLSKDISRANIAGGIFIAITFIIEVFKKISEKFFRLLILVDDGAYEIPDAILPALEELIKKVKDMPFFIDTVLIGSAYSDQAQKLLKLTNLCNGELYGIKGIKDLTPVLMELSEKKRVSAPSFTKQKIRMILPDNEPFFINLADDPNTIKEVATCSICFQSDDQGVVACPSCDAIAHRVCWAQWAETSSIGISHVFRCHNCFNILKLDKQFIKDVQTGKIPTIAELNKMKKKNIVEYLHELEAKNKPQVVQTDDPFAADVRAMIESKRAQPQEIAQENKKKRKANVSICPNCSKIMMGDKKKCPSCGFAMF
ncbi:MAG: VWA domain-containing protein [Candidatus Lokiarchaeota archaeon]|nr:VWA domain-containing protein [Candidatus Lokiarchaeota archaeon]